jgi:uncharacterized protein (DUF2235 family)
MSKNIVICADGTWSRPECRTNVWEIFNSLPGATIPLPATLIHGEAIKRDAPAQTAFYLDGVGTRFTAHDPAGGAAGVGLHGKVLDAYILVSQVYEPGDKLFLFGFSRGAFTARALAGFIAGAGLMEPSQAQAKNARVTAHTKWWRYKEDSINKQVAPPTDTPDAADSMPIRLVGVFDTVGALGIPFFNGVRVVDTMESQIFDFADLDLSPRVEFGLHAVAIDEKRKDFIPTLWNNRSGIAQTWFAGVHSDVGGGYPSRGLADITLEWMLSRAKVMGLAAALPTLAPDPAADRHESAGFIWQLTHRVRDRTVAANATIDPSVDQRFAARADYAPPPLARFPAYRAYYPPRVQPEKTIPASAVRLPVLDVGQSLTIEVFADKWWNAAGIEVSPGETYSIVASGTWHDATIGCDAQGWDGLNLFRSGRRVPGSNWFHLCLAVSDEYDLELHNPSFFDALFGGPSTYDPKSLILPVGTQSTATTTRQGALYFFANDMELMYGNNTGSIEVTITCLSRSSPAASSGS